MSGTILSRAGWNTSGFLGEHSVSDKSLACGCGIRRVKEVKHSTLSAFSYFVLKIRASEGRKEVGEGRNKGKKIKNFNKDIWLSNNQTLLAS